MNKEAQRIAIAEACGWRKAEPPNTPVWWKNGEWVMHDYDLPDYLNDLNAMREAWETLSPTLQTAFSSVLFDVCGCWHAAENATAEQRAKAFLLVVGKWEDA